MADAIHLALLSVPWAELPSRIKKIKELITTNADAGMLAISHGWIPRLLQDSALISTTHQAEITILTPPSSPTVFNQPIILAILCSIPDRQYSVVKGVRTICIDDSAPVVLNRTGILRIER